MVQRKPKRPPAVRSRAKTAKKVRERSRTSESVRERSETRAKKTAKKTAKKVAKKTAKKVQAVQSVRTVRTARTARTAPRFTLEVLSTPTRKRTGVHHFVINSKGQLREVKAPPRTARPLPAPSRPAVPKKPSRVALAKEKARLEGERLAREEFQRALGLPQEYEPRRPPRRLVPPVKRVLKAAAASWDRARKLAGGTWQSLALALHTTSAELRLWRQNDHPTGLARRDQFIKEQEEEQRVSAADVETFNRLLAEAKRAEFSPDYGTAQGRKEGPHTVGYYWTRNYNRAPSQAMIDDVCRWLEGLRGKPGLDLWHATGEVYQFGGEGFRRGYKQQSLVTVIPQSIDPEAADFSRAVIAGVPALRDKSQVISLLRAALEAYRDEARQTLVLWITMRNYRKKTAQEISDYWHERYEDQKEKRAEREAEPVKRFQMSFGLGKKAKKRTRG